MHASKRSATVTCKDSVELLAVGRDDFIDIFMPVEKDQEPEHIQFLRTADLMKGWPIHKLPYHDPKICCFTYFRYVLATNDCFLCYVGIYITKKMDTMMLVFFFIHMQHVPVNMLHILTTT